MWVRPGGEAVERPAKPGRSVRRSGWARCRRSERRCGDRLPCPTWASPQFKKALERCAEAAHDHLWVAGYPGGFVGGLGPHFVALSVPFALADEACEALRDS
jgi:hypothetical protein